MSFTRSALALSASAALIIALAGCAPTAGGSTASTGVVIAIAEPEHLIPAQQSGLSIVMEDLFAPLTSTDSAGKVTYVQAKSITSPDAKTWTITLRDGWTFHNGDPVTAKDYVDSWNYAAYGPNATNNGGSLAGIQGFGDLNPTSGKPAAKELSGLKVIDTLSFSVTLSAADSQFPLEVGPAQTAFYPMPPEAFSDLKAYDRKPIGNGPFTLTQSWKDNQEFSAKAFAAYKGPKPLTDKVTFRPYADAGTAYTDVQAGNADVAFVPANKMTSVSADFGKRAYPMQSGALNYLGLPLTDPRFSDIRVRQAISMSIDRSAVNKAIYGGFLTPASSFTPPSMAGYQAGLCGQFCKFDPTAAKALLAEAGGFTGPMTLFFPGGFGFDGLMDAYANQIRQNLGIADVVATPSTDFASYLKSIGDGTANGPHWGNWGPLFQSQQNTLRNLFTAEGGGYTFTGYSNPDVDSLLASADAETDATGAEAGYIAVQKRVFQDFPIIPTFYGKNIYVVSEKIKNLPSVAGLPDPTRITLKK